MNEYDINKPIFNYVEIEQLYGMNVSKATIETIHFGCPNCEQIVDGVVK